MAKTKYPPVLRQVVRARVAEALRRAEPCLSICPDCGGAFGRLGRGIAWHGSDCGVGAGGVARR